MSGKAVRDFESSFFSGPSTARSRGSAQPAGVDELEDTSIYVEDFIQAVLTLKNLGMALAAAALATFKGDADLIMAAMRQDHALKTAFRSMLEGANFATEDGFRSNLVSFAEGLDQTDGVTLCEWLGVPLVESSGHPVGKTDDQVARPDAVVDAAVLPSVLDGVLRLPRDHWEAAMAQGTFRGVRPGTSSSVSSGFVNVVSYGTAEEIARERLGDDIADSNVRREAKEVLSDGVAHEVGHTMDNALPQAHNDLCQALGYENFGKDQAAAYLSKAGVGWDEDPEVAAQVVTLWLDNEDWSKMGPEGWSGALLTQAYTDLKRSGPPDDATFKKSSLFSLLETSKDPSRVDKTSVGGTGLGLYARAGEAQIWGPAMYAHLTAWNNTKAAMSDREYCAELYRMAMSAQSGEERDRVVSAYPAAAQDWLKKVEQL